MTLSMSLPPAAAVADAFADAHPEVRPTESVAWRRWADAMPDACLWLDPGSARIVDCNRALFGLLGFTRSEVIGWPLDALAEPRHLALAPEVWRKLASGAALRDIDCMLRARHGGELAVSATTSPVLDRDGRLVAALVIWRDITDRRRREQALQARKRQLKSLAYELVATDTRESVRSGQRLQQDVVALLARAQSRMRQLGKPGGATLGEIEELLSRASTAAHAEAALLAGTDPGAEGLQAAIERLAHAINREGPLVARVEGVLPEPLSLPPAMRAVLLRVVQELALNARRHARARHLWIRPLVEEDRLSIVVGDDGIGFDVTRLPIDTDEDGGSGLYSAEARMQAIGGRLVLQSRPGRGTRAIAAVPLQAASPPDTMS